MVNITSWYGVGNFSWLQGFGIYSNSNIWPDCLKGKQHWNYEIASDMTCIAKLNY